MLKWRLKIKCLQFPTTNTPLHLLVPQMLWDIMLQDNITDKTINVDGIQYAYDSTRSKWLSLSRCCIQFGLKHKNVSAPRWLSIATGTYSNNTGYTLFQQGTLLYASTQASNICSCEFKIYEETESTGLIEIFSVKLENEKYKFVQKDVDITAGEIKCKLLCDLPGGGFCKVDYPNISIQAAFRL